MNENKRKIMIIGVGGIGSYLAPLLKKVGIYSMYLADPDIVEDKNLLYQNFSKATVGQKKVDSLSGISVGHVRSPYNILTDAQIKGSKSDLVVCCADNLDIRRLLYRQGFQDDAKVKWLDLRAQGRNGALISYLTDPKFSDMFLQGPDGSFSCQGDQEKITPETVHFTHVAVAGMAAQWIQRWFNGEEVKDKMVINI
tara:strand:- start:179 stop:769 length:591 start_codon:yes stop_codon:yes gene_type:complete